MTSRSRGIAQIVPFNVFGGRFSSVAFMLLALFLFIYSAIQPDNLRKVRTGTADLMGPALLVVNKPFSVAGDYIRTVTGLAGLQAENARLKEENARLYDWYHRAMLLDKENRALHDLLKIQLPPQQSYVTAQVVADTGNAYMRSMLVMAGSEQGVESGQPVLSAEGVIGRVVEVGKKTARILLMTDINARIPVLVQDSSYKAILSGTNNAYPHLDYLPRDHGIQPGARVVTSGHGGLYPYGLPVGEVVKAEGGEVAVRPYADLNRIQFVRIVRAAPAAYEIQKELTGF